MCAMLKKHLPSELAGKVPDPEATEKVETFTVDNRHAKEVLGMEFTQFEQTIEAAARRLA